MRELRVIKKDMFTRIMYKNKDPIVLFASSAIRLSIHSQLFFSPLSTSYHPWFFEQQAFFLLLASHVASTPGLETDDNVCDLHVPLLLQMGKNSSSEENFTLANSVQVGIQF